MCLLGLNFFAVFGNWTVKFWLLRGLFFCVFLQKKEAARPKEEVIEKEEEIVHEDNDWGKSSPGD